MYTYLTLLCFTTFFVGINAGIDPLNVVESVKFYLYTKENPDDPQLINANDENSIRSSNYNSSLQTKFIIHGFLSSHLTTPNRPIREAYFATGSYNIIAVDWSKYAYMPYISVASKVLPDVAVSVAKLIDFLHIKFELNFNELVVIGHSLGAHVAGFTGKQVKLGKIEAIVGIDPARPFIDVDDPTQTLTITDANYVVTIHATIGRQGVIEPVGHTSFYPNWGRTLESCPVDIFGFCPHLRANLIYAAGVRGYSFAPIYQCSSFDEILQETGCNKEVDIQVGDPLIVKRLPGIFYFDIKDSNVLTNSF